MKGVTTRKVLISDHMQRWTYRDLPKLLDIYSLHPLAGPASNAIELLARCPPDAGAQAAAAWSVLESMVVSPADRRDRETNNVVAAHRASEVAAAAWLRFESNLVFIDHVRAHEPSLRAEIRQLGAAEFADRVGDDHFTI